MPGDGDGLVVIAHRGDPVARVENTLGGIEQALADGARIVEIDIRLTADGEVVLLHDPTLLRIFGDPRPVAELTLAEVAELAAPDGSRIPTLADALALVEGRAVLLVDMTERAFAQPAVDVVRGAGAERGTLWCGDHGALAEVRGLLAEAEIYLTMPDQALPTPELVAEIRPRWVNPPWRAVDAAYVTAARALGVEVSCWTVDDVADARALAGLGVRRIISNWAGDVRREVQS